MFDKVETSGGKVIVPKIQISRDMGFFVMFVDPREINQDFTLFIDDTLA